MKNYLEKLPPRERGIALVIGVFGTWFLIAPPRWTGFADRTLWDWLDMLMLPAMLIVAALILRWQMTQVQSPQSPTLAPPETAEAILQSYLNHMTELLLDRELQYTNDDATRQLARFRTLTALHGLDGDRKGVVIKFLHEARLIHAKDGKSPIIDLRDADLSGAKLNDMELQYVSLKRAYLKGATLARTNLNMAKMNGARLMNADLSHANLNNAEMIRINLANAMLSNAELHNANLAWADFNGADLRGTDLQWSILLWAVFTDAQFSHKTILPDSSNWTTTVDLSRYTDNQHPEFWSSETGHPFQRDIPTKDITSIINDSLQ